jgi:hypothetical protein
MKSGSHQSVIFQFIRMKNGKHSAGLIFSAGSRRAGSLRKNYPKVITACSGCDLRSQSERDNEYGLLLNAAAPMSSCDRQIYKYTWCSRERWIYFGLSWLINFNNEGLGNICAQILIWADIFLWLRAAVRLKNRSKTAGQTNTLRTKREKMCIRPPRGKQIT